MDGIERLSESLARRYAVLSPHLDERQRRLWLGTEAVELGRGGVTVVAQATGVHPDTIARGAREVHAGVVLPGRVRSPGGGRKRLSEMDIGLATHLETLVDRVPRGDRMSLLLWTTRSTGQLANILSAAGHPVSARTVARLLRDLGYNLQLSANIVDGHSLEDRDMQFRYVAAQAHRHAGSGAPVISVHARSKRLVEPIKDRPTDDLTDGQQAVHVQDFLDIGLGKPIPYGICDVSASGGWIGVGPDRDTAPFAVATLRRWWETIGRPRFPGAEQLLICADGGAGDRSVVRAWKIHLASFATDAGLHVTVAHLPSGTSRWTAIEHRLLSQMTRSWRDRPLTTHQMTVDLIGVPGAATRLSLHIELDTDAYATARTKTDEDVAALNLQRHDFLGEWNYSVHPDAPRYSSS